MSFGGAEGRSTRGSSGEEKEGEERKKKRGEYKLAETIKLEKGKLRSVR